MHNFFLILLNWNSASDTLECLASLEKLDYPHYEILLIDNGSTDDSVEVIQSAYPDLKVLKMKENLGFSGGCNRGLEEGLRTKADIFLLINNDTVVAPAFLTALASAAENFPEAGAFALKSTFMMSQQPFGMLEAEVIRAQAAVTISDASRTIPMRNTKKYNPLTISVGVL